MRHSSIFVSHFFVSISIQQSTSGDCLPFEKWNEFDTHTSHWYPSANSLRGSIFRVRFLIRTHSEYFCFHFHICITKMPKKCYSQKENAHCYSVEKIRISSWMLAKRELWKPFRSVYAKSWILQNSINFVRNPLKKCCSIATASRNTIFVLCRLFTFR